MMTALKLEQSFNRASQLHRSARFAEAEAAYRKILSEHPTHAETLHMLGLLAYQSGSSDQAITMLRQVVSLKPAFFEALNNLGNILREVGQLPEALGTLQRAIHLRPDSAEAHCNYGIALRATGETKLAVESFHRAIVLRPNFPEAFNSLGNALKDQGQLDAAGENYRRAIALRPNYPDAFSNLAETFREQALLDDAIAASKKAITLNPAFASAHSNLVLCLSYHPGYSENAIAQELHRWNEAHAARSRLAVPARYSNPPDPHRRLKIGYVSPDFCDHAVGRFLLPLLQNHDRRQFELIAYAHVRRHDSMTEEIRTSVDRWRDITSIKDVQAAEQIRLDGIDILIDLALHTSNHRLMIFARKPAPVQATYLAYAGSSGLETMDYRISDPYLDPPTNQNPPPYIEQTMRLKESYWCYQPPAAPPIRPPPVLTVGHVTFGCLNNFCKTNDDVLLAWAELLKTIPGSKLVLHAHEGSHRQRTLEFFQLREIDAQRVRFIGKVPMASYLENYQSIDIALDTFPFGGGTTTCDALWLGVPVVSFIGSAPVGRGGLSILSNIGLPELAVPSIEKYVSTAATLATDFPRLSELRRSLRARMQQSPLMDAPRFARNFEVACRTMWWNWCQQHTGNV